MSTGMCFLFKIDGINGNWSGNKDLMNNFSSLCFNISNHTGEKDYEYDIWMNYDDDHSS